MAVSAWRPKQYRWHVAPAFDGADALARRLGTAPLVAQLLANRGLDDEPACRAFLEPKLTDLHDPSLLLGCEPAAERIARALADGEKICLYGDYDVDGMTGVAILDAILQMAGGQVDYYIPHRLDEGYGVNADAVEQIIASGAKLLITIDCGISAVEPLTRAARAGVDVIVTDHHGLGEALPPATAIVHPLLDGQDYPNPHLAGAGVALKLAWQVARQVCGSQRVDDRMKEFLLEATCLAALGTIADVVPLVGENRSLAVYGLRGLAGTRHVGLRALIAAAGLDGADLDATDVGFRLAPRLNACGRMGHAMEAVRLLTGQAGEESMAIAEDLNRKNVERQKVEQEITRQACEMVDAGNLASPDRRAIVLVSHDWHGGVVGIVASRLVSRYGRPTVVISANEGGIQGSGRSIPGFHMRDALAACAEYLQGFGGHEMAGGFRLKIDRDHFDAFAEAFVDYANQTLSEDDLVPALAIDAETTLPGLSYHVVERVQRMAPFGQGNPAPLVLCRGVRVVNPPRRMGRSGGTVGLVVEQDGVTMRAVGFGMGDLADAAAGVNTLDLVAQPTLNTFRGRTNVELQLKDVGW